MKWLAFLVLAIVLISLAVADGEIWEEDDHEVLIRSERGTKNRGKLTYFFNLFFRFSSRVMFMCLSTICFICIQFLPCGVKLTKLVL